MAASGAVTEGVGMSDERDAPRASGDRADDLVFAVPVGGPTTVVRRGGGRARLLVVAVVVLLAVAAGVLVTRGEKEVDADAALAAAQAAFRGDDAYRVMVTLTGHAADAEDGEATESGGTTEAVVLSPERWKALDSEFEDDESYETSERRRVGDEIFVRERGSGATRWNVVEVQPPPDQAAELAEEYDTFQSQDFEDDEDYGPDGAVQRRLVLEFYAHVLPFAYDPAQVEDVVLRATAPVIEERLDDGGTRLRVEVPSLPEIAAVAEEPIEPMDLELELDADHRPRAAGFVVEEAGNSLSLELEFTDWGASLAVDAPTEQDVERTPWVEEDELADLEPELLVLPTELPDDLELVSAEVGDVDDEECRALIVEYATRTDTEAQLEDYEEYDGPELEMSVRPGDCDAEVSDFDDELGGLPATVEDGYAEVRFGDVIIELDGSLDPDEFEDVVRSLEPVTPDEVLARFPSWLPEVVQSRYA
jgi:hypothetical protein